MAKKARKRPVQSADYQKDPRGLWGGHTHEFPQPLAWYWPGGEFKRHVTCSIASWIGSGIGASHYHASVREEDNYVWNGERWAKPWRPDEGTLPLPRSFDKAFMSEEAAIRYINRILKKHFPIDQYELESIWSSKPRPGAKYLVYTSGD